jgi:hypothetical protein
MKMVIENNALPPESYVVEIDGNVTSVFEIFLEALKAGMELKQKFPHSHIKVHDAARSVSWRPNSEQALS